MIEIVPNWHPVWVHFPIALLSVAVLLFLLATLLRRRPLAENATTVARWNLVLGGLFLVPALITGYLAWGSVEHDSAGHEAMKRHLWSAWITTGVFIVALALAWLDRHRRDGASIALRVVLVVGLGAISVTGYLGAENVYRHGIGVERLPDPDDHHHGHGNGHDHAHDHGETDRHEHDNGHEHHHLPGHEHPHEQEHEH